MTDCILWEGSFDTQGYGRYGHARLAAHRRAYEIAHGEIPPGFDIHHRCGEKGCINPDHLEAISRRDHVITHRPWDDAATVRRSRTTCPHGHPLDSSYAHEGRRHRRCLTCHREQMKRSREAAKRKKGSGD